jgi:hypothetical protein
MTVDRDFITGVLFFALETAFVFLTSGFYKRSPSCILLIHALHVPDCPNLNFTDRFRHEECPRTSGEVPHSRKEKA